MREGIRSLVALSAFALPAGPAAAQVPLPPSTQSSHVGFCAEEVEDQSTGNCFRASSVPTFRLIYPYPGLNSVFTPPAFVGGGENNAAAGNHSTVGGGRNNTASNDGATVGGGNRNWASGLTATIGGGEYNSASGDVTTVGGGTSNEASGLYATIAGGKNNKASVGSPWNQGGTTVGGGVDNTASGDYATVGGGKLNRATDYYDTVGGGLLNMATGRYGATVGGGVGNLASGYASTVGGGEGNVSSAHRSTVAGGLNNTASGNFATVGGGNDNTAPGKLTAIGGGIGNTAAGDFATVAGGSFNTAQGDYSFAAGRRAKADHEGAFVWGDSQPTINLKLSSAPDQFNVYCSGGARFFSNSAATTGVLLAPGGGSWTAVSDRASKENLESVDVRDVLHRVVALPLSTWNYRAQSDSIRHMGPMAQDFYAAFGLGLGDKTIDTIDPDGVALAAIQGLNETLIEKLAEKDEEIAALSARVERLETLALRLEGRGGEH